MTTILKLGEPRHAGPFLHPFRNGAAPLFSCDASYAENVRGCLTLTYHLLHDAVEKEPRFAKTMAELTPMNPKNSR